MRHDDGKFWPLFSMGVGGQTWRETDTPHPPLQKFFFFVDDFFFGNPTLKKIFANPTPTATAVVGGWGGAREISQTPLLREGWSGVSEFRNNFWVASPMRPISIARHSKNDLDVFLGKDPPPLADRSGWFYFLCRRSYKNTIKGKNVARGWSKQQHEKKTCQLSNSPSPTSETNSPLPTK
jgi:hypothetical protein